MCLKIQLNREITTFLKCVLSVVHECCLVHIIRLAPLSAMSESFLNASRNYFASADFCFITRDWNGDAEKLERADNVAAPSDFGFKTF